MTTKILRELLKTCKLTFVFPGELADNYYTPKYSKKQKPLDIKVVVYPKAHEGDLDHPVFINGIPQRLLYNSPQQELWFKKTPNDWFKQIMIDWRVLLDLDNPRTSDGTNKLYNYLLCTDDVQREIRRKALGDQYWDDEIKKYVFIPREKSKQIPQPYRRFKPVVKAINKNPLDISLVYVKDLNTGLIERMPAYKANKLVVQYGHYDYTTIPKWNKQQALKRPDKLNYWLKIIQRDEDGNPIKDEKLSGQYIPKTAKPAVIKLKYLVRNRKLVGIENNTKKKKKERLYDKDAKRQLIVIKPALETVVYKTDNSKYNKEFTFRLKKKTKCISEGKSVLVEKKRKHSGIRKSIVVIEKPVYKTEVELVKKPNKRYNKYLNKKVIDYTASKRAIEEFVVPVYEPEYEYVPMVFNGKRRTRPEAILDKDGQAVLVKKFKKLNKLTATIKEPTRTTYKSIVVKQYPSDLSRKRGVIKRNMKLLKEQEEKRKQDAKESNNT